MTARSKPSRLGSIRTPGEDGNADEIGYPRFQRYQRYSVDRGRRLAEARAEVGARVEEREELLAERAARLRQIQYALDQRGLDEAREGLHLLEEVLRVTVEE